MKACLAQYNSVDSVAANLARHREVIKEAAALSCDFVLFPELSLTGYRPSIAAQEAVRGDDPVFGSLQTDSDELGIGICAGMPLLADRGVEIGMLVYRPGQRPTSYAKQMLHADELAHFVSGDRILDIEIDGFLVAPAICYEAMQPTHGEAALSRGVSVYAASVAKTAAGMEHARSYLSGFAARHGVITLLVNAVGPGDDFVSAGGSAAWDATGTLLGELAGEEGLLFVEF